MLRQRVESAPRDAVAELERLRDQPDAWTLLDCQVPSAEFGVSLDSKDELSHCDQATAVDRPGSAIWAPIRGKNAQERRPDNLLRFLRTRKISRCRSNGPKDAALPMQNLNTDRQP